MFEVAIGVLGLLIAGLTYKKTYLDRPKEELEHFILQFKATQSTSKKVRKQLQLYAEENNAYEQEIFGGITVRNYLIMMEESFDKNLSDDLLKEVLNLKPSKLLLISMTEGLNKQLDALILVRNLIDSSRYSS